jgi:predicted ATPase
MRESDPPLDRRLIELEVENFRSLQKITLPLGPLNVLVGPNGAGKTNVLEVFRFLVDVIRTDLEPALEVRGGFDEIAFWGGETHPAFVRIALRTSWTQHSSTSSPDEYRLQIVRAGPPGPPGPPVSSREETFHFRRADGQARRILIRGDRVEVARIDEHRGETLLAFGLRNSSSGLSTLPRLSGELGGAEVAALAERLASFRVFDVNVEAACRPSRFPRGVHEVLESDAANLASFLLALRTRDEESWRRLVADAVEVLPQLVGIDFDYPSGPAREVVVILEEEGMRRPTQLADASYGTIRLLGILALLYDPEPPALTCIEEIDHGLHPQALELLVERVREASERTQFLIATHSPTFADRLKPEELIVCERRRDGSSAIPALSKAEVNEIVSASEGLPLGELWFSGALGGDL